MSMEAYLIHYVFIQFTAKYISLPNINIFCLFCGLLAATILTSLLYNNIIRRDLKL